jgi:cell wall-associated NlpC family hydrolase
VATHQIGVRYRAGGISPRTGFDCSGLVYYAHAQVGIEVPRTTGELLRASRTVHRAQLRPGDLVFFRVDHPKVSHVGIYLGDNRFVHAPSTGKRVSVARLNDPYWDRRFVQGGRI